MDSTEGEIEGEAGCLVVKGRKKEERERGCEGKV